MRPDIALILVAIKQVSFDSFVSIYKRKIQNKIEFTGVIVC